jgi:hypothetical protein
MKYPKKTKPFWFKNMSHEDMVNKVNIENPISLKYNESLINRIHMKYPILDKSKIALIILFVFQTWRESLILGKILNFHNLFFDTKLFFFPYVKGSHILPSLKVKMGTPPKLRKL